MGTPDFAVPSHIKDEIKRQLDLDNTNYCDPKGLLSLREAISSQNNQTRGLQTNPEHALTVMLAFYQGGAALLQYKEL